MGRLAANDSKRGERAARGAEMSAGLRDEPSGRRAKPAPADEAPAKVVSARAHSRSLVALVGASALLAAFSVSLRAQSGRKASTPTAKGPPLPTAPPAPVHNHPAPVAEPPPPKDKRAYPARQNPNDAQPSPDSTQGARAGQATPVEAESCAEEGGR